ncbi:MAG TPA: hypothetical protein PLL57_04480 [Flavobacteriales bacterium]|nr:hypothetical protein [Flavobacteriales bacterium]
MQTLLTILIVLGAVAYVAAQGVASWPRRNVARNSGPVPAPMGGCSSCASCGACPRPRA